MFTPPKWMVYNNGSKPYVFNKLIWGYPYFWKIIWGVFPPLFLGFSTHYEPWHLARPWPRKKPGNPHVA